MSEDTGLWEDLASTMGVPFPFNRPFENCTARRALFPVQVYIEATEVLHPLLLGVYCKIYEWYTKDQYADRERVVDLLGCDEQADNVLAELFRSGCLLTPSEHERIAKLRELELYGPARDQFASAGTKPKRPAPAVWPSYTTEEWRGVLTTPRAEYAPPGTSVVYFLFDAEGNLIYIGSTDQLWGRMRQHAMDKAWARFWARGCTNREAAYWLEAAEIVTSRPPLNIDYSLSGRPVHVPDTFVASVVPRQTLLLSPDQR